MRLPGAERAHVDPTKVRDYLLSHEHRFGRSKAAIFEGLGYRRSEWRRLQRDLKRTALANGAVLEKLLIYGRVYRLSVILQGPSGRTAALTTVWIVRIGGHFPRLVTAFPGEAP